MSRVASSQASVLSSSSSTPSASAASAHITADGRDDAGRSSVHSFTEKEEMTSTQPHILASRPTSSPPSALAPAPTATPKPQGLRALSQTSTSLSPKRQKREDFQRNEVVMIASSSRPSGDEPTTVVPVSSNNTTASDVTGGQPRQGDVQSPALPASALNSPPQVSTSSSIVTDARAPAMALLQHAPCLPQRSPRQPLLQPMSSVSASTGVFEVMLNHARVRVDRRYPFLNPTSLFTAHTTSNAICGESVEGLDPPLHRYGHRPVLLLDYTGMLHLRHQRRARRQEILAQVQQLLAERQDQIRSARAWRMRLLRATRGNKASITHKERASSTDEASGTTGESDAGSKSETSDEERENDNDNDNNARREEEPDNADGTNANTEEERRNADENVLYTHADVMRLIGATGERRAAITRELAELRTELRELAHAKQLGAANREGCVLMLPSPETQEVRLCSGHHYRTVCFVGEELMDVVPGEGPVPRPLPQRDPSTRLPVSPERHDVAPPRLNRELGREGEDRARREDSQQPLWATAEVSGYAIYARQQQHETRRKRRRSSGDGGGGGHEAEEDGESDEAPPTLDAFLALPACEAAMYREWAIRKHSPSSPEP